jgi:hypothetical protein
MTTRTHYQAILTAVEAFATQTLKIQVLDPSDEAYGGFRCPERWVCEPWAAANTFASLTTLYLTPDSRYYHSAELLERMHLAFQFILRSQHEDGTIDGYFCGDVRAASNVAFASHPLLRAYRWLTREHAQHEALLQQIETFLRKGIRAIKSKPLFTANHLWTAAAVLVEFDKIFVDSEAVLKAEDYLRDGIDINNDGVYSEGSPISSMVSNTMLLSIGEKLNRPLLIEFVRRSLNFLLHTFHANGEVATEFSHRKGEETGLPSGYGVWKKMSIIDHNGYFATAADLTLTTYLRCFHNGFIRPYLNRPNPNVKNGQGSRFFMTSDIGDLLAIESEINNDWITQLPIPQQYEVTYPQSHIARIRSGNMSATIIGTDKILFALQNGNAIIDGFRIKYAYHGFRDYVPTALKVDGKTYITQNEIIQWVCRPTPQRREVIALNLQILVKIDRVSDGFEIHITTHNGERIPIQLEFGLRKQGTLSIGDREYDLNQTNMVFLGKEPAKIVNGDDEIQINGGVTTHKIYTDDDDWTMNRETARLILTPITPYNGVIRITCG